MDGKCAMMGRLSRVADGKNGALIPLMKGYGLLDP